MADNREQSAAWDSEKKLDNEEKSLIGNEAEDRNLTGSTTYVTLPEQGGDDQQSQQSQRASGNNSSGKSSSESNHDDRRS